MVDVFSFTRPLLHAMQPETAHHVGLCALRMGLLPTPKTTPNPMLVQHLCGLEFKNPVGLAAGFDKNAQAVDALLKQGFGFVEAGTVTPLSQTGNAKPRIFRLKEDRAVINRLGFNNDGLQPFIDRFSARDRALGIAGANIGKNKEQVDAVADYVRGLKSVYPHADYITINISSPNTQGLRDLQAGGALSELLAALLQAKQESKAVYGNDVPLFLKIAPDLEPAQCEEIARIATEQNIDALIVSNTTISRPASLKNMQHTETGGLSGAPLFALSTQTLSMMYKFTQGKMPLVGVGGICSPRDAYVKIRSGASLVQLYTALTYQGFALVRRINRELPKLLARDGFSHIGDAVGKDVHR